MLRLIEGYLVSREQDQWWLTMTVIYFFRLLPLVEYWFFGWRRNDRHYSTAAAPPHFQWHLYNSETVRITLFADATLLLLVIAICPHQRFAGCCLGVLVIASPTSSSPRSWMIKATPLIRSVQSCSIRGLAQQKGKAGLSRKREVDKSFLIKSFDSNGNSSTTTLILR